MHCPLELSIFISLVRYRHSSSSSSSPSRRFASRYASVAGRVPALLLQPLDGRQDQHIHFLLHRIGQIVPVLRFQKRTDFHQRVVTIQLLSRQQARGLVRCSVALQKLAFAKHERNAADYDTSNAYRSSFFSQAAYGPYISCRMPMPTASPLPSDATVPLLLELELLQRLVANGSHQVMRAHDALLHGNLGGWRIRTAFRIKHQGVVADDVDILMAWRHAGTRRPSRGRASFRSPLPQSGGCRGCRRSR